MTGRLHHGIALLAGAGELHDLRNPGSAQIAGFLAFLMVGLGVVALVEMATKAVGASGRRRAAWLILMGSLIFVLLTPLPLLASVTTKAPAAACGHPFLAQIRSGCCDPGTGDCRCCQSL